MQVAAAQKREIEAKEAVRLPEEPEQGAPPIKDRAGRSRGGGQGGQREGEGAEGEEGEKPREEVVRDPSLGNRVDLSG